jgi:hypothetical protein
MKEGHFGQQAIVRGCSELAADSDSQVVERCQLLDPRSGPVPSFGAPNDHNLLLSEENDFGTSVALGLLRPDVADPGSLLKPNGRIPFAVTKVELSVRI